MKFPIYRQRDAADCGPTCLKMISKFYGKDFELDLIREKSYIGPHGVSLLGLSEAAELIGFDTQGVKVDWDILSSKIPLPCIVHWNHHHFVVVYKIDRGRKASVYVADPSKGLLRYTVDVFMKSWIGDKTFGIALLLEPTNDFYSMKEGLRDKRNLAVGQLLFYLSPYKKFIFQLVIGLLGGMLISLAFPFLTQSIVDYGITNNDLSFVVLVLISQLFLSLGLVVNNLIQSWLALHVTTRVSIKMISNFLAKLMRLPIAFFYTRTVGDVMQRINDQRRIQTFMTTTLVSILFAMITLTSYSTILFYYDSRILLVFIVGSAFYIMWISFFLKQRGQLDYKNFQEMSGVQSNLVQMVNGMQELRLAGAERQKRWEWERFQTRIFRINIRSLFLNQNQTLGSSFIDQSKNIIISFLAAKAVIDGDLTLGGMMSIQYIIGQINSPIQQCVGFIQSAQDAKISLDRLHDVYKLEIPSKLTTSFRGKVTTQS